VFPRKVLWGLADVLVQGMSRPTGGIADYDSQSAGTIEIVEYTAVDGNIYHQLKQILRRVGAFNAKEAAREIKSEGE
jgi:hypothetical protein